MLRLFMLHLLQAQRGQMQQQALQGSFRSVSALDPGSLSQEQFSVLSQSAAGDLPTMGGSFPVTLQHSPSIAFLCRKHICLWVRLKHMSWWLHPAAFVHCSAINLMPICLPYAETL